VAHFGRIRGGQDPSTRWRVKRFALACYTAETSKGKKSSQWLVSCVLSEIWIRGPGLVGNERQILFVVKVDRKRTAAIFFPRSKRASEADGHHSGYMRSVLFQKVYVMNQGYLSRVYTLHQTRRARCCSSKSWEPGSSVWPEVVLRFISQSVM
jgi:hypothetical protein